ncbi:hypothetical protein BDV93DRAFT_522474 [Ceratobasidium sp. AG-I]|nr:hypothetical protein BDV93DRAFT_522474 [Ceratobasidium sp. AG-I]
MQKVFDNGEILSLILGLLSRQLCARLITTSQNFLKQGAPHIWRKLHTPEPLLLLIPGVKKVVKQRYDTYIELPSSPADFSRFDYYARFVQRLDVFTPSSGWNRSNEFNIGPSWQTILFRAQQSILLPNLREFKLNKYFSAEDDPALWLTAFLSPSVKTFEVESIQSYKDAASSRAAVALNLVTQRCPDLENVTFYLGPPERAGTFSTEHTSALHILMGAPISRTWLSARNLRSLVSDVYALDADSLLALGELPHLSSLEIRKTAKIHYSDTPERLPASVQAMALSINSFPSLRHLVFHETHSADVLLLWNHKPLVEKLNRVELTMSLLGEIRIPKNKVVINEVFLTPFLPALCTGSPQLTELVIDNLNGTPELGVLWVHIDHFRCLASLPLQHIKLVGIQVVHIDPENHTLSFAEHAAALWPMAVDLNLRNQEVDPAALHHFATLPNLRCLVVSLLNTWPYNEPNPPTLDDHPLHTLEFNQGPKAGLDRVPVDRFSRYLLSFWPNLQQVSGPTSKCTINIGMLNQSIQMSQGVAEAKQRITDKYGAQEVYDLLPMRLRDFLLR